jgi:hypothetical protein
VAQRVQLTAPSKGATNPSGQRRHVDDPAGAYKPAAQGWQDKLALLGVNLPPGQLAHDTEPKSGLYLPGTQSILQNEGQQKKAMREGGQWAENEKKKAIRVVVAALTIDWAFHSRPEWKVHTENTR